MEARFIDPARLRSVPARELLKIYWRHARPHADALGCTEELASVQALAPRTGAQRQLQLAASEDRLADVVAALADAFAREGATLPSSLA